MTVIENPATDGAEGGAPRPTYSYVEDAPDLLARWSTAALLVATAVLYLWGLSASGWANSFYSAAAQAGSQDWTAWFFGSLDAGNAITVDKPPASIWLMALSVRLFGLSSWSILVPQAILGVGTVSVLYASLRRSLLAWAGAGTSHRLSRREAHWAAFSGAMVLALTPVATLMFRFNNPDALLVFILVVASYCTTRAVENASRRWLALAGVAIGLGFLTKMLQAFVILPALVVAYAVAAPTSWRRRLTDLLVAFAALVASFGWYIAVVEFIPTSWRPYIGGSQTNSILELILGYNGLGRITGDQVGSVGGSQGSRSGETGLTRLFDGVSGGMVTWMLPAALLLATAALVLVVARTRRAADGTGQRADTPLSAGASWRPLAASLIIWLGWLLITSVVFSFMAGIYHDYYTVALAPAIGACVGLGAAALWADRGRFTARFVLAVSAVLSGVWSLILTQRAGGWYLVAGWVSLGLLLLAAAGIMLGHGMPKLGAMALTVAVAGSSLGPAAYSFQTAATAHTGSIVTAGPVTSGRGQGADGGRSQTGQGGSAGQGRDGQGQNSPGTGQGGGSGSNGQRPRNGGTGGLLNGASVSSELAILLSEDAGSYTWVAATTGAQNAASYQLATEEPVMALGGFNGTDPAPTLAQFQAYVAEGRIHYFISGGVGGRANGGSQAAVEITDWVEQSFTAQSVGSTTIYDLTQTS